jgi:hypothetical protein
MRRASLCIVGLWPVWLSCGAPIANVGRDQRDNSQADVDPQQASKDAKGVLEEIIGSLRAGHTDALLPTVVDQLVVLGPGDKNAYTSRTDAVVAVSGYLNAHGGSLDIATGKPVVGIAPGGHSAWLVENITVGNDAYIITALTSEKNDIARLAALFISPTMAMKKVRKATQSGTLSIPAHNMPAAFKADASTAGVIAAFNKGIADPELWKEDLLAQSEVDKALVIGPTVEQFATGAKAMKKFWKKRSDGGVALKVLDRPRAGLMEDGRMAWVTAAVEQTEDNDDPLLLRLFAIYVRDDNAAPWHLTALHQAVTPFERQPE